MGNLVGYAHSINAMELPTGAAATVRFQWPICVGNRVSTYAMYLAKSSVDETQAL